MNKLIIKDPYTYHNVYINSTQFRIKNYTKEKDSENNRILKYLDMKIWKECVLYISDNIIIKNYLYISDLEKCLGLKYIQP